MRLRAARGSGLRAALFCAQGAAARDCGDDGAARCLLII
jgi:hypothetical protein